MMIASPPTHLEETYMKVVKLTMLICAGVSLTGCSSIWSGVSDFADMMSKETQFLSLRKSKTIQEGPVLTTDASATEGIYKTDVGMYKSTSFGQDTGSFEPQNVSFEPAMVKSDGPCPEGAYLTAENSCMLLESDLMELPELPAASTDFTNFNSGPDCPEDTYMTEDNTCMFFETETFEHLAGEFYEPEAVSEEIYNYPTCPDGSYLNEKNECMMIESVFDE